jgi:hypothetical protein
LPRRLSPMPTILVSVIFIGFASKHYPLPQPLSRERERVAVRPGEGKSCI